MGTTDEAQVGIVPEQLTEDNYEYWKACLKNYLIGQGLWDVISKKEAIPKRGSPEYEMWEKSPEQYEIWRRKNALALHAIQLSCGSDLYFKFMKSHSAREVWDRLAEKRRRTSHSPPADHEEAFPPSPSSFQDHEVPIEHEMEGYEWLCKAVEDGDKNVVTRYFKDNPNAITATISPNGDTALHVAILAGNEKIAEELVQLMPKDSLALTNKFGSTPLSLAAISGLTKLAKAMVDKSPGLVSIANEYEDGQLPVILASLYGRRGMVRYLYTMTPLEELSPEKGNPPGERGATLLNCLITAEIYDVATDLLKHFPHLAFTKDHDDNYTIRILAHKPSAFCSGTRFAVWKKLIYSCISVHSPMFPVHESESHGPGDEENPKGPQRGPNQVGNTTIKVPSLLHKLGWILLRCFVPDIQHIHKRKSMHHEANELLGCIFKEMKNLSSAQLDQMGIDEAIYDAIKHGIVEFIVELLKYKPDFVWRKDNKGRTIFSHAIVLRQEKIFNLIYAFGTKTSIMARRHDIFHNNFLHLAAKLSPPPRLEHLSGAALQMQRELQWFKEVESMVQPKLD
ncbi:hypothetical protein F0562_005755 [Nyssa sinensis]|uniref:DUF4219 domain-containing protein n=1 Tax=Nyssa sinensis TaxID=561372 RepID=A0A5J5AMZ1_9ASTE|nr:hypothetical protein F0562_005755 [Nyssa sinensis]